MLRLESLEKLFGVQCGLSHVVVHLILVVSTSANATAWRRPDTVWCSPDRAVPAQLAGRAQADCDETVMVASLESWLLRRTRTGTMTDNNGAHHP